MQRIDGLQACDRTLRSMEIRGFSSSTAIYGRRVLQVELDGTWRHLLGHSQTVCTWRKNVRYAEKRLANHGPVEYSRFRPRGAAWGDGDPCWPLYDACESLAGRSWQGSSTTGTTLSHAAVQPFLRAAHEAAAHAGAADISLLSVGGVPLAFAYCYQNAGYVYGLRMGFDADQTHEGAGTVLLARLIEDSFQRGDRIVDLGTEYLECKRHWQTRLAESCSRDALFARADRKAPSRSGRLEAAGWRASGIVAACRRLDPHAPRYRQSCAWCNA